MLASAEPGEDLGIVVYPWTKETFLNHSAPKRKRDLMIISRSTEKRSVQGGNFEEEEGKIFLTLQFSSA